MPRYAYKRENSPFAGLKPFLPIRSFFALYTNPYVASKKSSKGNLKKCRCPSLFSCFIRLNQPIDPSTDQLTKSMTEIPFPLLLLRSEPIGTLAQENRHIAQIHAKALGQTLAFAASTSLAVEPRARRAAETALAVPFPRQPAGVAVA